MSERTRTILSVARGSLVLILVCLGIPLILFGHLSAVLTGQPGILA